MVPVTNAFRTMTLVTHTPVPVEQQLRILAIRLLRECHTSGVRNPKFIAPLGLHAGLPRGNRSPSMAERKIEKEEKEENSRRVERQYGEFTRSFTLPSSVDPGQVRAHYDKGVLKIKLAKKAEAKPKQIKVNVGSEKTLEAKV
jgi:hypothetical protein